ncbi:MAG TPA: multicopper oxidase domain-containing protein [Mycobacteriales bacterium]|nr:multicopper oxidase domain-containing protein [Mycobacteriales bacterium]
MTTSVGGLGAASASLPATNVRPQAAAVTSTAPSSATVTMPQGAAFQGYQPTTVDLAKGGTFSAHNFDSTRHTVTSVDSGSDGQKLFSVAVNPGQTLTIPQASTLAPGTYNFYCQIHPSMKGTLVIDGSGGGVQPAPQSFDQRLVLPPVLTGSKLRIPIKRANVQVLPTGPATQMWTYGGTYPGPTIVRPAGHDTKVTFVNHLPKSVGALTVHFHGDHHKAANDGQPTRHLIRSGDARTYDYPLTDNGRPERAAFDFYHDHRMDETARNNWFGLQGMFLVTDGKSKKLGLPGGQYDVPLMVSERSFTSTNQLVNSFPAHPKMVLTGPQAPPNDATVGDHILVDGKFAPYLNVAAHRYRLRLLNTSPFTSYDFALSDGRPFFQVGTGNGLLPRTVVRQDILLGPAQRADVIVDFGDALHKRIQLESIPRVNRPAKGIGTPTASIMQFRVTRTASDSTRIPSTLQAPPKITVPTKTKAAWSFDLGGNAQTGTYWTVNGKPFDPNRVDLKVPLGATQLWKLHNASTMTHYIHIHEEQWHTISRDGKKPPPWERGLEDTWRLDPGETVKVAAKFTDYTGVFMIHCHMLDHEDHGLMAQFAVVKPGHGLPKGYYYDKSASAATAAAVPRQAAVRLASDLDSIFAPTSGGMPSMSLAAFSTQPAFWCDLGRGRQASRTAIRPPKQEI